jgi:hypothetical protein
MAEVDGIEKLFSTIPRKRFGRFRLFGTIQFGFSNFGDDDIYFAPAGRDPILLSGIYRTDNVTGRTKCYREPYYITKNPRTESQQDNRLKFADAIAGWQGLTEEQQNQYNIRAKGKPLSGYNLFLREFMLS